MIVILTDDQSWDTLPTEPPAMPWLQAQLADPTMGWLWFPNAFISTPLCCPSRATILTGRYAHHTGVQRNGDGRNLDESQTIAVWLHDAGYVTALVGKYLNLYPWDRGPYVPEGWDRWMAKLNLDAATTYQDYTVIDQGEVLLFGHDEGSYATDVLATGALDFLRTVPAGQPYFLLFTPTAPHAPWVPAVRHEGAFAGVPMPSPTVRQLNDVKGKPGWIRALPPLDGQDRRVLLDQRRHERETLLSVDEAVHALFDEVRVRGELDRTVFVFLTDNGYSFGEHRWSKKTCPYEACVRTPFAVRSPWTSGRTIRALVSNVDLAPTIADLADLPAPPEPFDGQSLADAIEGGTPPDRQAILLEWAGSREVPAWTGVRTRHFLYVEDADGTVELYDLHRDPLELHNLALDPRSAGRRARLADELATLGLDAPDGG